MIQVRESADLRLGPYFLFNSKTQRIIFRGLDDLRAAQEICKYVNHLILDAPPKRNGEHGTGLLEFAILLPVAMLLAFCAANLLWLENAKSNLDFLAREGAICLARSGCDASAYIANAAPGLNIDTSQLTITAGGNTVALTYSFQPIVPTPLPAVVLHSTAVTP